MLAGRGEGLLRDEGRGTMVETNQGTQAGGTPLWRRRSFWLGAGSLVHGRGTFGLQLLQDPAAAKDHVATAVEWALRGVEATEEQKQQARKITDRLIDGLEPLAKAHHDHHVAMVHELQKPQIDRAAIERLRRQELELADQASKLALDGVADLADVLTPEQRQELIRFARRMHGAE
jgi:protein CpxP